MLRGEVMRRMHLDRVLDDGGMEVSGAEDGDQVVVEEVEEVEEEEMDSMIHRRLTRAPDQENDIQPRTVLDSLHFSLDSGAVRWEVRLRDTWLAVEAHDNHLYSSREEEDGLEEEEIHMVKDRAVGEARVGA